MLLNDINIRDPFILADDGHYYMYGTRGASTWGCGTGFDVYVPGTTVSVPKWGF